MGCGVCTTTWHSAIVLHHKHLDVNIVLLIDRQLFMNVLKKRPLVAERSHTMDESSMQWGLLGMVTQ